MTTTCSKSEQKSPLDLHFRTIVLGPSLDQNGGMATVQKLILEYNPCQFKLQHICTHDEGSIFHRGIVFANALIIFTKELLLKRVDLVHIHVSERGSVLRKILLILLSLAFRQPVLIHTHGAEFEPFFRQLPIWAQKILSFIFCQCDAFIVLSKSWQKFYTSQLGLNPEKVFTLPNAVKLPSQIPNRSTSAPIKLVFCGRVGHRKGAFDLLQALTYLPADQRAMTQLMIAGDGDLEQGQYLSKHLKVSHHVTFLGWLSPQQRDDLLAKADIFVLPSYHEGLPVAILEAMAWGLPIVTTPIGGIPEVIVSNQNGLLVEPGNVQQLSKCIQLLIEDKQLRLSLGKAARETAESFDAKIYGDRLANIYNTVLQAH